MKILVVEDDCRQQLTELLRNEMGKPGCLNPAMCCSEEIEIIPCIAPSWTYGLSPVESFWYNFVKKFGAPISLIELDRQAGASRQMLWAKYPQLTKAQIRKYIRGVPRGSRRTEPETQIVMDEEAAS
jgi:hypothetical protein